MTTTAFIAVFSGAGIGAVLRWLFALWLNPLFPTLPLGTLAANLLGGLLVGVASAFFTQHSTLAPEWRLLAVTGFLGGLTTFSTFSAEVVHLISRQQPLWALATAGMHLLGSLALTGLGIVLAQAWMSRG
ncbi:fluoride efflux transporter CrcB [Aquabacterium sp.]|uniref:fluoride efflux transporter CrcB n=1 Tax=Aquabacterium sp. TaxID=1872578 RepID=UPI002C6BB369|nr:fluoride efflux transporter CrcB [Aquabacterium sp.]HSW04689.1 fluoride efflux transporter CrcB [Aquabacterium sp.]